MLRITIYIAILFGMPPVVGAAETFCGPPLHIEQLLQDVGKYHGKVVCATGKLHIEFEGTQLSHGGSRLWLELYDPPYTNESVSRDRKRIGAWEKELQDRCVVLSGTFNREDTGHFGMWPAGIDYVTRIERVADTVCGFTTR